MKWITLVRSVVSLVCAGMLALGAPRTATAAEYLLQPGDVLSLMIVGAPELTQRVPVEMDGEAWFPVIGGIPVAGTSLKDVRQRVSEAYSATGVNLASGVESVPQLVRPNQVHVTMAEYRPVFVTGELLQPRTIEFRPGLTLRQAVAMAGTSEVPQAEVGAERERIAALVIDLSRIQARIWSL